MTETENTFHILEAGSIVKAKKKHPCGSDTWEILRAGADLKMKCSGCQHIITVTREKFKKQFKEI